MMIRGVTFDFGGTIVQGDLDKEHFRESLLGYLRSLGFSGGEARLRKARKGMMESLIKARVLNREIRFEDLYQGMLFRIGIHPNNEVIDHIHQLYIRSFKVELIYGVEEVLEVLKDRYRLGVISNAISNLPRYVLKKFSLEKHLDAVVISRDLGIRKPDPEIFNFTILNLGLKNHEVVHVGDSLEHDVQGAKNAGMKAIWIERKSEETNVFSDYKIDSIRKLTSLL